MFPSNHALRQHPHRASNPTKPTGHCRNYHYKAGPPVCGGDRQQSDANKFPAVWGLATVTVPVALPRITRTIYKINITWRRDESAYMSKLVQPMANKLTARLSTHAHTQPCHSTELSITTKHYRAILTIPAKRIHGFTVRVRQKEAYKRPRNKLVSSSTTIPRYYVY